MTYWRIRFSGDRGPAHGSAHSSEGRALAETGQRLKAIVRDIWERYSGPLGMAVDPEIREQALEVALTLRNLLHTGDVWLAYKAWKANERTWKETVLWSPMGSSAAPALTMLSLTVTPDPGEAGRI